MLVMIVMLFVLLLILCVCATCFSRIFMSIATFPDTSVLLDLSREVLQCFAFIIGYSRYIAS